MWVESGYASYVLDSPSYSAYEEHFEYLYSYAISYENSNKSLTDYVAFLRENMASSSKLAETTVLHSKKEGVQVMTIHKSKGLEFPIVIVYGMGTKSQNNNSSYIFNYQGHLLASANDKLSKMLLTDEKRKEEAEIIRVLYVAATRAEKHLIFTGSYELTNKGEINGKTGISLIKLLDALYPLNEFEKPSLPVTAVEEIEAREDYKRGNRCIISLNSIESNYSSFSIPTFNSHKSRVSVTSLENEVEEGEEGIPLPSIPSDPILTALSLQSAFGTLCHKVIELSLLHENILDIPIYLSPNEEDNKALLADAIMLSKRFFASKLYERIKSYKMKSEFRFYTYLEDEDAALEGVMDLIVFLDDYNLVVDYKSDSIRYSSAHRVQLTKYIEAAEELFKKPCYGTLYYLRSGEEDVFIDSSGATVEL